MEKVILILPFTEDRIRDEEGQKDIIGHPLQLVEFQYYSPSSQRRHSYIRYSMPDHSSSEESLNTTRVTSCFERLVKGFNEQARLRTERFHSNESTDLG